MPAFFRAYNFLMRDLPFSSIEDVEQALKAHRYVASRSLATTVFLALSLDKPLLLEGEPGVGKTEVAKVLAEILDTRLIRLQCYEGIDVNNAVYEWAYARQMLHIRLLESAGADREAMERVGRDRSKADGLHESDLLSGEPHFGARENSVGVRCGDVDGRRVAVKRADSREHEDRGDERDKSADGGDADLQIGPGDPR